jgi:ArsR family transcriptional regulator, lead/cadmium/zinc/bismuth-responsive transcriptional repressor
VRLDDRERRGLHGTSGRAGVTLRGMEPAGASEDSTLVDADRVAFAQERLPNTDETDRLADWFRVLGDPTRTRLLYALLEGGELCVSDLAYTVGSSETTVSHALRWLRKSDIVRSRRAGRLIYYSLDDAHVRMLLDLGREHLRHT